MNKKDVIKAIVDKHTDFTQKEVGMIIDEFLDVHILREQQVHHAVIAEHVDDDVGVEYVPVDFFRERQVREQHCGYDADEQQHSLCPGLVQEPVAGVAQVHYTLTPGIERYQSHSGSEYYLVVGRILSAVVFANAAFSRLPAAQRLPSSYLDGKYVAPAYEAGPGRRAQGIAQ